MKVRAVVKSRGVVKVATISSPRATERPRLPYLPGLDGLRALAVMAVFAYHANVSWAPGGFLGVDVFFVISGYLITALMLAEWQRTGTIDLRAFWRRRAVRLLPALVTMLVAVALVAPLLAPEQVGRITGDIRAALAYVSNWWLIFEDQSYFEAVGRPPLLQHLWSLAVEEQFYLLWPLALPLLLRRRLRSRRLAGYLMAAAGVSTLLMAALFTPTADPSRAYYGTDTRLAAILVGAALASVWAPWRLPRKTPHSAGIFLQGVLLASVVGLGLIITNVDRYDANLYQGGFLGVALLSALAVAVVVHPAGMPSGTLLGSRLFVWLGRRSYGIYLWHWPVLMVTRPRLDVAFDGGLLLMVRLALTLGLAAASYRFVESPVQGGALGRLWADLHRPPLLKWRSAPFAGARAAAVTFAVVGLVVVAVVGPTATTSAPLDAVSAISSPVGMAELEIDTAFTAVPGVAVTTEELIPEQPAPTTLPAVVEPSPTTEPSTPAPAPEPAGELSTPTPPESTPSEPPAESDGQAVAAASVTAIGDSVLLAAKPSLEAAVPGIFIDAVIGRQIADLIDLAQQLKDTGRLGTAVIVQAGNNGPVSEGQLDRLLEILGHVGKVLVVNVEVPRPWESSNNENMAASVAKRANCVLVDWNAAAASADGIFYKDGTHLRAAGTALYASVVKASL